MKTRFHLFAALDRYEKMKTASNQVRTWKQSSLFRICWQASFLDSSLSIAKLFHLSVGRIKSLIPPANHQKPQRGGEWHEEV